MLRLRPERLCLDRAGFLCARRERGIGNSVHFIPLHLHPFYRHAYGYKPGDFPWAEQEYARYFRSPFFPGDEEGDRVTDVISELVRSSAR